MKKRLISSNRAKTQEVVPPTSQFERRYESRAYSGELPTENGIFGTQKPLFENSELFGRQATEDLSRIPWYRSNNSQNNLESSTTYITHSKNNNIDYEIFSGQKRIVDLNEHSKLTNLLTLEAVQSECLPIPHHSPPITEDAGSRITHYTASTFHDDFLATEESSIRGKIDRLFDFVESDDSRKTIHAPLYFESKTSTDTSGIGHSKEHRHPFLLNFEEPSMFKRDPSSLRGNQQHQKITSTDRRNTVSGPELDHFASDLEYSLAQYRERQKEHVRRRIPSADEPKFFRSPFLSNQHADQSINSYRKKRFLGSSTDGSKGPISNYSMDLPRKAFTTSTPIDSPQRKVSNSTKDRYYPELTFNQMSNSHVPNDTFLSSISRVSEVDKDVEMMRKINRLAYMIENTQKQMSMSEAALMDAIKMGRKNQGVAAHRSILITRETLRLQRTELRRLHAFSSARRPLPPIAKELKGSVVFKNVVVYLNKLFVYRMNGKNDSSSYSFVAIFKYGSQVEATELVPLEGILGEETNDKLAFETKIKFSDVPIDFMVTMEIYAMRVTPNKPAELSIGTSLANMCKSLMGPPQKKSATSSADTAFKFRGRLVLDRDAAGDRVHFFDNVTYPLEGTVMITTECSRLPEAFEVDFRGFLTMYHSMNKTASWERYWAVLRRGVVFFWKYPDDEQMGRETKMQIDLTKCTNNAIEKCGFDLCPRTNTFAIDVLVDTYDCDTIENGVEKRRVLLSADSSQMLTEWLFNLNRTLDVIRGPI
uniref:PH domain-containing protein n=1 Tax=Caenorhabditis japonica TaxID=281687 RepID=A0A8R1HPM8_CAEJA